MKKVIAIFVVLSLIALAVTACGTSKEERRAEFIEWYNSIEEEKQAEFIARYNSLEAEKQAETRKHAEDINRKVLASARPVSVDLIFTTTLKQVFLDTGVDKRINAKRAADQLAPLTIDEIYNDFQEEAVSEIPQFVQNAMEIFADGNVKVHVSSALQSGPMSFGWLPGQNFVMVPPYAYFEICNGVSSDKADEFTATFTMLADIGSEDRWKKEVLFDGTVRQLCSNEGNYPKFYEEQGIVVFKRPVTKLLPVPAENSVVLGSVEELEEGDKLYYARMTEDGMKVEIGFFQGVRKFSPEVEIIEFRGALNPEIDAGTPVYYVSADKNSPVRLVGFVIPGENISAVSAEFVLTGVDEVELADIKD